MIRQKKGVLKQICSDCKVVSAGFYRVTGVSPDGTIPANQYFLTLKNNNYEASVEINEIHLNLFPKKEEMNYTKYYDEWQKNKEIFNALCGVTNGNCGKELWSTEIGASSDIKFVSTHNLSDTDSTQVPDGFEMYFTRDFQADDLIRRMVAISGFGITGINWNGYLNNVTSGCPSTTTDEFGESFYALNTQQGSCAHPMKGLYFKDSSNNYLPKKSYLAYQVATSMLNNVSEVKMLSTITVDENHVNDEQVFSYKITKMDGSKKYAAWCDPFWKWDDNNIENKVWNYNSVSCSANTTLDLTAQGLSGTVKVTKNDGTTSTAQANSVPIGKSPVFIEK